jgi:hypothetical protein
MAQHGGVLYIEPLSAATLKSSMVGASALGGGGGWGWMGGRLLLQRDAEGGRRPHAAVAGHGCILQAAALSYDAPHTDKYATPKPPPHRALPSMSSRMMAMTTPAGPTFFWAPA